MKTYPVHVSILVSFGILLCTIQKVAAQISKDDSSIQSWATGIEVYRGWVDIADTTYTYDGTNRADYGTPENALGKAEGTSSDVVSLGDGGVAILSFDRPIINETGADFAVFENGFSDTFLELAFVEVSSDGKRFVRFPAVSLTQYTVQIGGSGVLDSDSITNLAGKYKQGLGTPFDLSDVEDSSGIDVADIRFVKIVDVIGCINPQYASYDSKGNIINDPWPTPYNSCGFDLDAVAVIHGGQPYSTNIIRIRNADNVRVYPNPCTSSVTVECQAASSIVLFDSFGNTLKHLYATGSSPLISTENLPVGMYWIQVIHGSEIQVTTILKQ